MPGTDGSGRSRDQQEEIREEIRDGSSVGRDKGRVICRGIESLGQDAEAGWGAKLYRKFVFMQGASHAKGGTSTDAFRLHAEEVLAKGGKLSAGELIHCRVRYFSDGVVFGGQQFVDEVFQRYRD